MSEENSRLIKVDHLIRGGGERGRRRFNKTTEPFLMLLLRLLTLMLLTPMMLLLLTLLLLTLLLLMLLSSFNQKQTCLYSTEDQEGAHLQVTASQYLQQHVLTTINIQSPNTAKDESDADTSLCTRCQIPTNSVVLFVGILRDEGSGTEGRRAKSIKWSPGD